MQRLKITNFKAHQNLEEINFGNKNFLLYGDNGAGKSSIYEALKLCFFRMRIEPNTDSELPENRQAILDSFYFSFQNTAQSNSIEIKINNQDFRSFQTTNYNFYMLNLDDVVFSRFLKLNELFQKVFFNFPDNIMQKYEEIQEKANIFLDKCLEDIRIEIDSSDEYSIKLENTQRNIQKTKEIKKYFNEAKLNLVIFALLFSAIEVSKDDTKKNILILDDFITSLDMSNRTFLMKHIFDTFKDFQILIFTHNVYFYNLIMYLINDKICQTDKEWQFANLYEIGNEHKIYMNNIRESVTDLEQEYRPTAQGFNISDYGNKLRKKFERLVYELSKIIMVGGVEESNKILEAILDNKNIYLLKYEEGSGRNRKVKLKDGNNLIDDIQLITTNLTDIQSKIDEYKIDELDNIREILKTLKLYRKVTMHSLSHGQTGQHQWSSREIQQTLILLKKLETNIKDLTDKTSN